MKTMNGRMARVFTALSLCFVALIAMLTWWQLLAAGDLKQKDSNQQNAYYEQRIERGYIATRDGVRLAGRVATKGINGDTVWLRRYPKGQLAAHVVGYDTRGNSRAGIEQGMNADLTGSKRDLGAVVGLLDGSSTVVGDDVRLTIDSAAQAEAERQLQGLTGAIVALEPSTGRVLAMASSPSFAPQEAITNFAGIQKRATALFDRATQASYAPGSTFKLVTAAAALDNGVRPTRRFDATSKYRNIQNFGGEHAPAHDLTYALTHSINTSFARLGIELGADKLRTQMEGFGFFERPDLTGLPTNELRASGLTGPNGAQLKLDGSVDTARVAIGQERLTVTPLQMAMVAGAIANDGRLVKPSLVEAVTRPGGGRAVSSFQMRPWKQAMAPEHARELGTMMTNVVKEGTGTAAALTGIDVAGKTGTADYNGRNLVWFVAFAPAHDPKVAIAVAIEGQSAGQTGGVVAAPKARAVLQRLLQGLGT